MAADINHQLGGLGVAVSNLNEGLAAMRAAQERAEARAEKRAEDANDSRRRLYAKVDDLANKLSDLDKTVALDMHEVKDRLTDVEATAAAAKEGVDDYKRVVQQGKGALLIVGFGGTAFGASVIWFFDEVVKWLRVKLGL